MENCLNVSNAYLYVPESHPNAGSPEVQSRPIVTFEGNASYNLSGFEKRVEQYL